MLTTNASFRMIASDLPRALGMTAAKPQVARETEYYLKTIEKTKSIDEFLADSSPDAYDRVVDRLLASPHYGERWARPWLDLARYADSHGYEKDGLRTMWKYRDWVIKSLNDDVPFDRFTIEQLAGDMLPNPTTDQLIASGFHRNRRVTAATRGNALLPEVTSGVSFPTVSAFTTHALCLMPITLMAMIVSTTDVMSTSRAMPGSVARSPGQ